MKKLLLLAAAGALMAACGEAPTAPAASSKKAPSARPSADLVCASGYVVAYDENGNPYCAPDGGDQMAARPMLPSSGKP